MSRDQKRRDERVERAILVGIETLEGRSARSMRELIELAKTAGAQVLDIITQNRDKPDIATFIGAGKVEELASMVQGMEADLVIFNAELSPVQNRNLVKAIDTKVLDRTELILDIFAQHARTREGKLQVELAQARYSLPRLAGRGRMMDRIGGTGGGIGVRGPGETKIDVERRTLRRRIQRLENEIEEVQRRRKVERRSRERSGLPTATLVGYTNSGKSTLLNALAGSRQVVARDRLFETLDPTTRRIELEPGRECLVTDTVGFIQDLPHQVVAAFQATLEEVTESDLLLHVVDVAWPAAFEQYEAADDVLHELGAAEIPTIVVLNKIDIASSERKVEIIESRVSNTIRLSALTGDGLDDLRRRMSDLLFAHLIEVTLHIPYDRMSVIELLNERGHVSETKYEAEHVIAHAEVDEATLAQVRDLVVSG
ncbi:MAG: GTPase HflX [candidate division WS1 bacterium]|nr:GTPase HflX [candidate division WS1 bacterium]